jgi:hypothetical protein
VEVLPSFGLEQVEADETPVDRELIDAALVHVVDAYRERTE